MTLYSYMRNGVTKLISLRSNPLRQKNYREQSSRQARPKYYTATINGFSLMQRLPRT